MFENLFTENQLRVLRLLPTMKPGEIGRELGISRMAVHHRQEEIGKKIGVEGYGQGTRIKIVLWAIWVGLIDLEEEVARLPKPFPTLTTGQVVPAKALYKGNEDVCRDHDFRWTSHGKDKSGVVLKRGICRLCGFDLGIERFCSRCRIKLPDEEPTSLCSECIGEDEYAAENSMLD